MERTRPRILALVAGLALAAACGHLGCRTINPKSAFHGTLNCSCNGTECNCGHCCAADARCSCRGTDAYGDRSAVGEPGEPR